MVDDPQAAPVDAGAQVEVAVVAVLIARAAVGARPELADEVRCAEAGVGLAGLDGDVEGRVRLCPYYFVTGEDAVELGGVLATLCPPDKKAIHGMPDAIMAPCSI